jgi:hypothetical protein
VTARGAIRAAVFAGVALAAAPVDAGLIRYFTREAAGGAAEGAAQELEPVLARTLADVDRRLAGHEDRIGNIANQFVSHTSREAGERLTQIDGIVEKRLLQVQLGANEVIDLGLGKVDRIAEQRLDQVNKALADRIGQVETVAANTLARVDVILQDRTADLGRTVLGVVDRADGALAARIEQLDEVAGRRLGNVDVIATKQRLGLERSALRVAWLIGLVVFIIYIVWTLWTEYVKRDKVTGGTPREVAIAYAKLFGKPLLRQAAVGGIVAAALWALPGLLPMAAEQAERDLVDRHARELETSYNQRDWTRLRFHASQLEFLEPTNGAHFRALAAKGELLRDFLGRPTMVSTSKGANALLEKVRAVEALLEGQVDPDLLVMRATVLQHTAGTRAQEHRAATLAAQALRANPGGFLLAARARMLVENYLHAPEPSGDPETDSVDALVATLDVAIPVPPGSDEEAALLLSRAMRRLDTDSSDAFVKMIEAQAVVARLAGGGKSPALNDARKLRNRHAQAVIAAWVEFDRVLRETPLLENNAVVLNAMRLNDVHLVHALLFAAQPDRIDEPMALASLTKSPEDVALKLKIAPARIVWARRYADLLEGPGRELIELQESHRFLQMERETLAFEAALIELRGGALAAWRTRPRPRPAADPATREQNAAQAAAVSGIYQSDAAGRRTPLALQLAATLSKRRAELERALEKMRGQLEAARPEVQSKITQALEAQKKRLEGELAGVRQALKPIEDKLQAPGPRMI